MRGVNPCTPLVGAKIQASILALPARRPSSAGADTGLHPICNTIFMRMDSVYPPVRKTVQLRLADSRDAAVARKPQIPFIAFHNFGNHIVGEPVLSGILAAPSVLH